MGKSLILIILRHINKSILQYVWTTISFGHRHFLIAFIYFRQFHMLLTPIIIDNLLYTIMGRCCGGPIALFYVYIHCNFIGIRQLKCRTKWHRKYFQLYIFSYLLFNPYKATMYISRTIARTPMQLCIIAILWDIIKYLGLPSLVKLFTVIASLCNIRELLAYRYFILFAV